tara:strand:- start:809 stop:2170 length:1362 start_codon:yes stop_codon:yes gene_type:complete
MKNDIIKETDPLFIDQLTTGQKEYQIPVEVFPIQIQTIIHDFNKYLNYPVEFTTISILGLTSVTMGNSVELEVVPTWRETAILFMAMVQDRGHMKSHPMKQIFKPLFEKEAEFVKQFKEENEDFKQKLQQYKEDKNNGIETEEPELPIQKRISVTKFSPEVLYKIHEENPKGLIIWNDELKNWFGTFNQYSKNADEQMYCTMFNGGHLQRDTITHGNQYIPKSFISIIGGIQPKEMTDFINQNTENGLIDRILFSYPEYLKMPDFPENDIPLSTVESWQSIYECLYNKFAFSSLEEIEVIRYTPEALELVKNWSNKITEESNNDNGNIVFAGIVSKAKIIVHRLAMILEALQGSCDDVLNVGSVGPTAVEGATALCEYFIDEALKIRTVAEQSNFKEIDIWLSHLPDEFTTKEAEAVATKYKLGARKTVFRWLKKDKRIVKVEGETGKYKKVS